MTQRGWAVREMSLSRVKEWALPEAAEREPQQESGWQTMAAERTWKAEPP